MNPGQIAGFLWTVAVWFFLVSVFAFPIAYARWRRTEREDAARTEEVLGTLLHDHTHLYEQDAL